MGPEIDPYGTPMVIFLKDEHDFLIYTFMEV